MKIRARLKSGALVTYAVPRAYGPEVWQWLRGLSCVETCWEVD